MKNRILIACAAVVMFLIVGPYTDEQKDEILDQYAGIDPYLIEYIEQTIDNDSPEAVVKEYKRDVIYYKSILEDLEMMYEK